MLPELKRSSRNKILESSSKLSKIVDSTASTSSKKSKETGVSYRAAKGFNKPVAKTTTSSLAFRYEIDCERVSDSINVTDLVTVTFHYLIWYFLIVIFPQQKHLTEHLKVNGKKNDLGDNVSICCQGQKVLISSKMFIPKRSLRFLSKKFLKKMWNIQVISKNKNSYEFKYVGTPWYAFEWNFFSNVTHSTVDTINCWTVQENLFLWALMNWLEMTSLFIVEKKYCRH